MLSIILINKVTDVARIKPIIDGLTPFINAFTPAYFNKPLIRVTIINIIIKDGKTTPNVANKAPKKPS